MINVAAVQYAQFARRDTFCTKINVSQAAPLILSLQEMLALVFFLDELNDKNYLIIRL